MCLFTSFIKIMKIGWRLCLLIRSVLLIIIKMVWCKKILFTHQYFVSHNWVLSRKFALVLIISATTKSYLTLLYIAAILWRMKCKKISHSVTLQMAEKLLWPLRALWRWNMIMEMHKCTMHAHSDHKQLSLLQSPRFKKATVIHQLIRGSQTYFAIVKFLWTSIVLCNMELKTICEY